MDNVGSRWFNRLLLTSALWVCALPAQTTITGTFQNPDGTNLTGYIQLSINRPTVNNFCATPYQVLPFKQIRIPITNGTMGSLSLTAGSCMVVQKTPTVTVGSGAGAGATASLTSGTDLQGQLSVTTGTGPNASGPVATIGFGGGPYNPTPSCTFVGPAGATIIYATSKASISITVTSTLAAHTMYSFSWTCQVMPYLASVYQSNGTLLYTGHWIVPNSVTSVNVATLDPL